MLALFKRPATYHALAAFFLSTHGRQPAAPLRRAAPQTGVPEYCETPSYLFMWISLRTGIWLRLKSRVRVIGYQCRRLWEVVSL